MKEGQRNMIGLADWGMRGELARIWEICFDEPPRPAKYFLNNYFHPKNCLVYCMNHQIAAAVYLLPACIATKSRPVQAHYIFAAATLPQYRGRGYMAALMAAAALTGANRGDRYSILLPATPSLYGFYGKSGYTNFFQVKTCTLTLDELCSWSGTAGNALLSYSQLNAVRNAQLGTGSVLWSDTAFCYAHGLGKIYGDKLVCSKTFGKNAYAICRRMDEDTCMVMELMADRGTISDLIANIICCVPAQVYHFRLPANSELFGQNGKKSDFGMIRAIGGTTLDGLLQSASAPYLGLSLD